MADSVVNWNAIYVWAAAVGVQYGTALYNLWKRCKRPTGYKKVQRGETVDGWKMVISPERFWQNHGQKSIAPIFTLWTNDDDGRRDSSIRREFSVLVDFLHTAPDGRKVYELCQLSLMANIETTIAKIVYDRKKWVFKFTRYLTSRSVAVVFGDNVNHRRFRIVLVDTKSKRRQIFTIGCPLAPIGLMITVRQRGSSSNQLSVLFCAQETSPFGTRRWQFGDAIYDIPTAEIRRDRVIQPTSSEELLIPVNARTRLMGCTSGFLPIAVIYNVDTSARQCWAVLFDQPGKWRIATLANWLISYRNTTIGSSVTNAVEAYASLSPPKPWRPPAPLHDAGLYHYDGVCGNENGSAIYAWPVDGGLLRRWVTPPSLQYLAAEAFCRANPNCNMAELKDRIGFDIFDGMLDNVGNSEDSAPIHL